MYVGHVNHIQPAITVAKPGRVHPFLQPATSQPHSLAHHPRHPLCAQVIWGKLLFGKVITDKMIIGTFITIFGVVMVLGMGPKEKPEEEKPIRLLDFVYLWRSSLWIGYLVFCLVFGTALFFLYKSMQAKDELAAANHDTRISPVSVEAEALAREQHVTKHLSPVSSFTKPHARPSSTRLFSIDPNGCYVCHAVGYYRLSHDDLDQNRQWYHFHWLPSLHLGRMVGLLDRRACGGKST